MSRLAKPRLPRIYLAGLVDRDTGRYDLAAIRHAIKTLTRRPAYGWPFQRALAAVLQEARIEAEAVQAAIRRRPEAEARLAVDRQAAEVLAARYDYDPDALLFEVNRRSFGSFRTTNARHSLPLFRQAWKIANERQRAAREEAPAIAAE